MRLTASNWALAAGVYLTAVLEYVTSALSKQAGLLSAGAVTHRYMVSEMIELAGEVARVSCHPTLHHIRHPDPPPSRQDNKRSRIQPRHIMFAIKNDEELTRVLRDVQFPWVSLGSSAPTNRARRWG